MQHAEEFPLLPERAQDHETDPKLTDRLIWKHLLKRANTPNEGYDGKPDADWEN